MSSPHSLFSSLAVLRYRPTRQSWLPCQPPAMPLSRRAAEMTFVEENPDHVDESRFPIHPPRPSRSRLGRLIRRVATVQDKSGFHKIFGLANLTSAVLLLSYGIISRGLTHKWQLPPDTLYMPLLTAWLSSTFLLAGSGAALATWYDRFDKLARDAFVESSKSVLLIAWFTWWASPCFPKFLSSQAVSALAIVQLIFYGLYTPISTTKDSNKIIAN